MMMMMMRYPISQVVLQRVCDRAKAKHSVLIATAKYSPLERQRPPPSIRITARVRPARGVWRWRPEEGRVRAAASAGEGWDECTPIVNAFADGQSGCAPCRVAQVTAEHSKQDIDKAVSAIRAAWTAEVKPPLVAPLSPS